MAEIDLIDLEAIQARQRNPWELHRLVTQDVPALLDALASRDKRIEELETANLRWERNASETIKTLTRERDEAREVLRAIHRRAYPKPDRTLGDCADELMMIEDIARAATEVPIVERPPFQFEDEG